MKKNLIAMLYIFCCSMLVLFYQNCGTGYESQNKTLSSNGLLNEVNYSEKNKGQLKKMCSKKGPTSIYCQCLDKNIFFNCSLETLRLAENKNIQDSTDNLLIEPEQETSKVFSDLEISVIDSEPQKQVSEEREPAQVITQYTLNDTSMNIPSYANYQGVNESMWNKISEIGDPLNCKSRVENAVQSSDGKVISSCDGNCINEALSRNNIVTLKAGNYKISQTIRVGKGQVLKGAVNQKINLISTNVNVAMEVDGGSALNININNAEDYGVVLKKDALVYRVIVGNTGVNSTKNEAGFGFSMSGTSSTQNCLVSVEAFNGYNEDGAGCESCYNGGNADGFTVKFGASNATFIDAHAHHNSDDGFDFWRGGVNGSKPTIRLFYSSANSNGKHPTRNNQDGNGIKLGASSGDAGERLVYGSATCNNKTSGYDKNNSTEKINLYNCSSSGNSYNYVGVSCQKLTFDPDAIVCGNL